MTRLGVDILDGTECNTLQQSHSQVQSGYPSHIDNLDLDPCSHIGHRYGLGIQTLFTAACTIPLPLITGSRRYQPEFRITSAPHASIDLDALAWGTVRTIQDKLSCECHL